MKYIAQEAEDVLFRVKVIQSQLDGLLAKLKGIRKHLILKALDEGWTREEIEGKLQECESGAK